MSSLEELIRSDKIRFYSSGRKIDIAIKDFGEYNKELVRHITEKSGNCISVTGEALEEYLKDPSNLFCLADFVNDLHFEGMSNRYPAGVCIHVDVDITKFDETYIQPKEEPFINGLGQKVCDAADWVPEMPYFEKMWHFALCEAIGCIVGYPGYEHPRSDKEFRHHIAGHISDYMIGTKGQLKRYRRFAEVSLKKMIDCAKDIMDDPGMIFRRTWILLEIEMCARYTRELLDNINRFQLDYKD